MNTIAEKTVQLLDRLDSVKSTGPGKWLARCPAHDDRSPSLSIRETDGIILIYCFAGCGAQEILHAVGLDMADLFPDRLTHPDGPRTEPPKFNARELFPLLVQEAMILALALGKICEGKALSKSDLERVNQAYDSVTRLHAVVSR